MQGAILKKYGVQTTINFELFEIDGIDLKVDAAHASGDTKIMKDEAAEANTTNAFTDEGQGYSLVLKATEMQAARIVVYVVDSAPKAWLDTVIVIETYGHASAEHAFDLDTSSVAQTGDSYARLGAPAGASMAADLLVIDDFVDELETRLSAVRAGYLDKLNITGNVASSAEVTAIQNNTNVRLMVPKLMERPDTGSIAYVLHIYLYDDIGNMEAPDSLPTITAENHSGVDRSANLGVVSLVGTGHYKVAYTLASGDAIEQLLFEWSVIEGGVTTVHGDVTQVVDTTAVDFTAADRIKLDTLHDTRCTEVRMAELDAANLPADVDSILGDTNELQLNQGNWLTATGFSTLSAAQINAEMVDVLFTDILPEVSQGIPPTTPTFAQAAMYKYMALTKKGVSNSGAREFYNNAGVMIWQQVQSDDSTDFTVAKAITGV